MWDDPIAAIATPVGEGGIAIVRISGKGALGIADQIFQSLGSKRVKPSQAPTHTLHHGRVLDQNRQVDEVLLAVMRGPRSYTGGDTVEISCHGGLLPAKRVLEVVLQHGARMAMPGEFTRRAFLNGRLDLAQAEAVADLIHSRTESALMAANEQLAGSLSRPVNLLRDKLMQVLAHIEAHLDFPDEDIAPDTRVELVQRIASALADMDQLLKTADDGKILRQGIRIAIVGRPNAGKSSLLNCLLRRDRAIVSSIPGTTRDTIEETASIRDIPVVFVDTAGLRVSGDEIELEGMRRSREAIKGSDLVLHVLDASETSSNHDAVDAHEIESKRLIVVRNKMDLSNSVKCQVNPGVEVVEVSCMTGQGIEALKDAIKTLVWSGRLQAGVGQAFINSRHKDALVRSARHVEQAQQALRSGQHLELVAMDLRMGANAVGEIVGKTTTEDLLDSIFSAFCIGK